MKVCAFANKSEAQRFYNELASLVCVLCPFSDAPLMILNGVNEGVCRKLW